MRMPLRHMTRSCAQLQAEILATIASAAPGNEHREQRTVLAPPAANSNLGGGFRTAVARLREHTAEDDARRVRPRH